MWFDGRAEQFDDCAGLEPDVGRRIAVTILGLSGAADGDVILDLGTGTGAVGCHFAALPCRYLGLDQSRRMLDVFRRKLGDVPRHMLLAQADGDRPWPIRDRALTAIFASRVVHHMRASPVVEEVLRTGRPGGCLLLGRVVRDADSLPSRLQRFKRSLLAEHGLRTRGGGRAVQEVIDACCIRGAVALPRAVVSRWVRTATPRQLLAAWEEKPRLSNSAEGGELTDERRAAILDALTEQARQEFGDLDRAREFAEEYTLEGARLP
jgi:SAM-dependent methyltransferase